MEMHSALSVALVFRNGSKKEEQMWNERGRGGGGGCVRVLFVCEEGTSAFSFEKCFPAIPALSPLSLKNLKNRTERGGLFRIFAASSSSSSSSSSSCRFQCQCLTHTLFLLPT